MYEEGGERQEGGTCRWVSWEEQVGRQEWGVRWGETVREGWRRRSLSGRQCGGGGEFSGGNVGLGCAITPPGRWRARTRFARDVQALGGTLRSIDHWGGA